MASEPAVLKTTSASVRHLVDPASARPSEQSQYLRIFTATVFIRDHDRSLPFFTDQLGFTVVADARFEFGNRWVAVAPPDGSAVLALIAPKRGSENYKLIGRPTQIAFIAEDINATFELWRGRGVKFRSRRKKPSSEEPRPSSPTSTATPSAARLRWIEPGDRGAAPGSERKDRNRASRRPGTRDRQAGAGQALSPDAAHAQTLDYAGVCIQARHVGGDYYDFLDLGRDRLGLVIGDIAGKGIAAALLMANLQANLRSQFAIALRAPELFLDSVNRFSLTTPSTAPTPRSSSPSTTTAHACATPTAGISAPRPSLHGSRQRQVERLDSTCTVMGLFHDWDCPIGECQLAAGDTLALYTDGVTESFDENEEEFGEERLIEALRRHKKLPAHEMVKAIVNEVQTFTCPERGQYDDITVIVAKCTADS